MENINKSDALVILGKNIRRIRLIRGITQESLASDIQKSVNFVSLVENGKTGVSISTLVDICGALGTDFNSLFKGVVSLSDFDEDSYIVNSLNYVDKEDKKIIKDLVEYILNSKNK